LANVETFSLSNGLRVVVQTDRSAPVVSVAILYHVGSRDERSGRTGFAHLFEHLMFAGTEHVNRSFGPVLADLGAQSANASTWWDHTSFFETVPTTSLERTLFLESERMGFLANAITAERLAAEIGVVLSEKNLKEANPFGSVEYPILAGVFPEGHPYRWSALGTVDDLERASLDDVRDWARTYYTPDNAVLSLVGDIDAAQARTLVERYFGALSPGGSRTRLNAWTPVMLSSVEAVQEDRAPNARLYRAWPGPRRASRDRTELDVVGAYLGRGPNSILHQALVEDAQLASFVDFSLPSGQAASMSLLIVNLRPGADSAAAEAIVEQTLADLRSGRIDQGRFGRARAGVLAAYLRSLEQAGGSGGRAEALALSVIDVGNPHLPASVSDWIGAVTPERARVLAQRYLGEASYRLRVAPIEAARSTASDVDRTVLPAIAASPQATFPEVERAQLENGLELVLVRREGAPLVRVDLSIEGGYASDPGTRSGLSYLSLDWLLAASRGLDPQARAADIGAELSARANAPANGIRIVAPRNSVTAAMSLLGDLVRREPDAQIFEAVRAQRVAQGGRESADLFRLGERVLLEAVFGADHPYAAPTSGRGLSTEVGAATAQDAQTWLQARLRPDRARLFIVGDLTMAEAQETARTAFARWRGAATPVEPVTAPSSTTVGRILLIDRPGAQQAMVVAGRVVAPPGAAPDGGEALALEILGGAGGSRLTLNLRERRGWSYWTRAYMTPGPGPRALIVAAPVQPQHAAAAVEEIASELRAISSSRAPTEDEIAARRNRVALAFPARFVAASAILDQIVQNEDLQRRDDYAVEDARAIAAVQNRAVAAAAADLFGRPMIWVVIGDRAMLESPLAQLGLGPVEIVTPAN
jgi:predicted Zn-dependent peptidase